MGPRRLQHKRVYETVVSVSSPAPQDEPPPDPEGDSASPPNGSHSRPGALRSVNDGGLHDNNSQFDFDEVADVAVEGDLFHGDSIRLSLDDDMVEPDSAVGEDFVNDEDEARYEREVAELAANRRVFEEAKQRVLDQLPASYLEQFGKVGFGRYAKKYYPAMLLSPYDVPGYLRTTWMTSFEKMKRQDRLESIRTVCIVFWYGADAKDCFSIIKPSEFVSYEEGIERKVLGKAYESALQKQEADVKLSKQEEILVKGMSLLEMDVAIPQDQRDRKKLDFYEEYEFVDVNESSDEEVPKKRKGGRPRKKRKLQELDKAGETESMENEKPSEDEVPQKRKMGRPPKKQALDNAKESESMGKDKLPEDAVPQKRKVGRPPKKQKLQELDKAKEHESMQSDKPAEDEVPAKRKVGRPPKNHQTSDKADAGKAKVVKKPRRRSSNASEGVISAEGAVGDDRLNNVGLVGAEPPTKERKKPGRKPGRKPKVLSESLVAVGDDGGAQFDSASAAGGPVSDASRTDFDVESLRQPSHLTSNVGEIEDIGDAEEDESLDGDTKDENFAASGDDEDSRDEDFEAKTNGRKKLLSKAKTQKKPRAVGAKQKTVKVEKPVDPVVREKRDYKRCCKDYLPLVEQLEQSVAASDFALIGETLDAFLEASANFSAPFLENHIAPVVKMAKQVIKEAKHDELQKTCKVLNAKLSEVYGQKKALVPTGFRPPLSRHPSAPAMGTTDPVLDTQARTESADHADVNQSQPVAQTPERSSARELQSSVTRKDQFMKESAVAGTAQPAAKAPPAKVKSFSLGKLGQMIQRDQGPDSTAASSATLQSKPSWLLAPAPNGGGSVAVIPGDENRSLAIEFLRGMAQQLPPDKVDADSMALALENALFEWANSRTNGNGESTVPTPGREPWVAAYWDRLHAIVAAMSGKKDSSGSTLTNLVLSGAYSTPMDLVELKEDDFAKSYNGQPIL